MNGYRVIVLEGGSNGKGLINWNFLGGVKMAVNFNNISVYEVANNPNAGCVYEGEMVVEGSDNSVLDADVQSRLNSLYAKINDPNSYAGSFAEALDSLTIMTNLLRDPIYRTPENLKKYKKYVIASKKGIEIWQNDISNNYKTPLSDTVILVQNNLLPLNNNLTDMSTCLLNLIPSRSGGGEFWKDLRKITYIYTSTCIDNYLETVGETENLIKFNATLLQDKELDPHYVENIRNQQQAYSCNCGWIDLNHGFTITTRPDAEELGIGVNNLWKQLKEESGQHSGYAKGFKVKYSQDILVKGVSIGIHNEYFVKFGLSDSKKKSIGLAILQEVSLAYESMQGLKPFGTSSFEPSDLVSNLLSFYFFIGGYSKEEILNLCDKKSVDESLNIYRKYPGTFSDDKYKNNVFAPRFFPNKYCKTSIFPQNFQVINPAIKGNSDFRDWMYFD